MYDVEYDMFVETTDNRVHISSDCAETVGNRVYISSGWQARMSHEQAVRLVEMLKEVLKCDQ